MGKSKTLALAEEARADLAQVTTYQAGIIQAAAHRTLQKECDRILKPYGITKVQWLIIGTVLDAGSGGISISQLTRTLGTTMPYMTTSVKLLESKGWLTRSSNQLDSRSKLIGITKGNIACCADIERTLRAGLRDTIYADVDPVEFKVYLKVLFQLRDINSSKKQS